MRKTRQFGCVSLLAVAAFISLLIVGSAEQAATAPKPQPSITGRSVSLRGVATFAVGAGKLSSPRAVWVQYEAAITPEQADQLIQRVASARFNTILYSVGSGRVAYRSASLATLSDIPEGYDPLAYLVQQAHARGIKVQAWWCPGYAARMPEFNVSHPGWDIAVLPGARGDIHWLNFAMPEARKFVADIVVEIAQKYAVDGVHLDYVRYPASARTLGISGRISDMDVSLTVRSAYQRLKAVRPDVLLTAAVLDSNYRSITYMQNWEDWLAGGYIDYVFPMAYFSPDESRGLVADLGEWQRLSRFNRLIPGLSAMDNVDGEKLSAKTPEQLLEQIRVIREGNARGFSIFDEKNLTPEQWAVLGQLEDPPNEISRSPQNKEMFP